MASWGEGTIGERLARRRKASFPFMRLVPFLELVLDNCKRKASCTSITPCMPEERSRVSELSIPPAACFQSVQVGNLGTWEPVTSGDLVKAYRSTWMPGVLFHAFREGSLFHQLFFNVVDTLRIVNEHTVVAKD